MYMYVHAFISIGTHTSLGSKYDLANMFSKWMYRSGCCCLSIIMRSVWRSRDRAAPNSHSSISLSTILKKRKKRIRRKTMKKEAEQASKGRCTCRRNIDRNRRINSNSVCVRARVCVCVRVCVCHHYQSQVSTVPAAIVPWLSQWTWSLDTKLSVLSIVLRVTELSSCRPTLTHWVRHHLQLHPAKKKKKN